MDIRYEKINESHFESLIALFSEFSEFEKQPDKMVNSVEQLRKEKDCINGYVALTGNEEVIGYATFFFAFFTWSGKAMYMDDLYVKKEFRGNGTGTGMMKKVIEHARKHECYKLRWQVSRWNEPAIKFYKWVGATIDDAQMNCDLVLR